MFNRLIKIILLTVFAVGISGLYTVEADASSKVMWGKTELVVGQIGKITILNDTPLVKLNNDKLETIKILKKGDEFRVYSYKGQHGGLYGVGGGSFVQLNKTNVTYATPSKSKLDQLAAIKEQEKDVSSEVQQVVDLINKERLNEGLQPLEIDTKLAQSAQAKSQDMKINNYFSHTSPTYGSPFDQMKSFGISYRSAGENIARGQRRATEVVDAWMKSPGHKANIMNPSFTHIGVGLSDSEFYWTQQFISQ